MIRQLENVDPNNYQLEFVTEFIKKVSPFTENNPRLSSLIEDFLKHDMDVPVTVALNEKEIDPVTKQNKIRMFMLWLNGTTLYTGTAFVPESEMSKGIHFADYEI
jgi:hypothetical protein